jgi:hypothetical protein
MTARLADFTLVELSGPSQRVGSVVNTHIHGHNGKTLLGDALT